jgi:hypothetical protein
MNYRRIKLKTDTICEYSVDTNGAIVNETTHKKIKGTSITKTNRYVKVNFGGKVKPVHRLVAETFVHNTHPDIYTQVNHIDGDRYNNAVENLEWCTPSMNVCHAYRVGLKSNYGEKNPISVLTEQVVVDIWKLSQRGHKPSAIIRLLKLDVSRTTVSKVTNGKNWQQVTSKL